jgi:hypothetical protein
MSKSQQQVSASSEQIWIFDVPPMNIRGAKMQLLTIGRVAVMGKWQGVLGQYFVGYAPLVKIPKDAKIPPTVYNGIR